MINYTSKKNKTSQNSEICHPIILKSCPFCGSDDLEIMGGSEAWHPSYYDPDSGGEPYSIKCNHCRVVFEMHEYDLDNLLDHWNFRESGKIIKPTVEFDQDRIPEERCSICRNIIHKTDIYCCKCGTKVYQNMEKIDNSTKNKF